LIAGSTGQNHREEVLVERFQSPNPMGCPKRPHSADGKAHNAIASFQQRNAQPDLSRALAHFCRTPIKLCAADGVALYADALLRHHREQVYSCGQVSIGGLPQLIGNLPAPALIARESRQRERVAEVALRASARRGAFVPAMRRVQVAQVMRPRGQNVSE
jgi:hypothetical protein